MPDDIKSKPIISNYLKMFKDIRSEVKENLTSEIFFFNPFSKKSVESNHMSKKNYENKRILTKWGSSYGDPQKLIEKEKEEYEKYSEELKDESLRISYKRILEEVLLNNLKDFRRDLVFYTVIQRDLLSSHNFEQFVLILEFFISLFSGINCKYFIDELGYLDMDFYAYENSLMNMAEAHRYGLQYRIMNKISIENFQKDANHRKSKIVKKSSIDGIIYAVRKSKKLSQVEQKTDVNLEFSSDASEKLLDKLNDSESDSYNIDDEIEMKNKIKFEDYTEDDVTLYPPHSSFNKHNAGFYRRYDEADNYHICEECKLITKTKDSLNVTCSSIFREIDRIRLIRATLSSIINVNIIKSPPKDMIWISAVFKFMLVLHDYTELKELTNYEELIKTYTYPYESTEVKRLNKVFRNKFGEDVGFYFVWITHYLSWLLFPSILGTVLYFLGFFISFVNGTNFYMYLNLFFAGVVILWANFYIASWKNKETFLNYIWGMENYKLDKSNEIADVPVDKKVFMGIKIPIITIETFLKGKVLSYFVIALCLVVTIIVNLLIFYVENAHIYADTSLGGEDLQVISNGYWLYITPVISFIVREFMSSTYKGIALNLTNRECHIHKDKYNSSLLIKIIFFEFFNYYFNLYYIAFGKAYFESCPGTSCYDSLAQQLTGILSSAIILDLTKLFWSAVYIRNKTKKFEKNLKENNHNITNSSSKYIYYTRTEYEAQDMTGEYLEIVMIYGYIIQFGACSPICFFIALLQTLFMRLSDAVNFSRLQYIKLTSEAHGIGVMTDVMKIMTFLGLITNVCIIFFTNSQLVNVDFSFKIVLLLLVENAVMIIMMITRIDNLPSWFHFIDKINQSFIKKYSYHIAQNSKLFEYEKKKSRKHLEESKNNA
jgi:hypothetical protein